MHRVVKPAEVRRKEILDCALRLFAAQGYDGTSVNDIIAALRLSKGAFYHHFESKERLLEALAVRFAEAAALEAKDVLEDETLDSFARLSAFLRRMRESKLNAAPELHATFEVIFRDENFRLFLRTQEAVARVVLPVLRRIIAEGVAERTFDTSDPDSAAEIILHLLGSTRGLMVAIGQESRPEAVAGLADRVQKKLEFIGTVVDRILGLPDGSIVLADADSVRVLTRTWQARDSAA